MSVSAADERRLREVALTRSEYQTIVERLGRAPNDVELGMLGVLWSEHCSYKTSKPFLRRLPTGGERVLQGPGENAGAVDVGDGWAAVFKVESHNHPSAIAPEPGAATGVGGIVRDVLALGARPVALLDSLRFGPLPRSARLYQGVVAGIGGYGNCLGIPTVGGEVYFEECYQENPLVNAMCVGLVPVERLRRARAEGVGNLLMLVGADTGRDGIHGAAFASLQLDAASAGRRPAVQVGNPFLEKCLMEALGELADSSAVVGCQDLGAGGLTSAVVECAARAGTGAALDVNLVPRREQGMSPYEVMLSESQERMLLVVAAGREAEVERVFRKWELEAAVIGSVTAGSDLEVMAGEETAARLPVQLLAEGAPVRERQPRRPAGEAPTLELESMVPEPPDLAAVLVQLLGSPNLASRRPVYRRYDHQVGNATLIGPGGDAALIRIPGTERALALTVDGNGRYCQLDPFVGAQIAVAEAARNIVATGAEPVGLTDCLNLGNPERDEVYWQLDEVVSGIATACRALDLPVVSGNVSLYNEHEAGQSVSAVYPTPVIGMVGVLEDCGRRLQPALREEGDFVLLLGSTGGELGGSEYLQLVHRLAAGAPPSIDLQAERAVLRFVLAASAASLLHSAHDVAEGGMLVALAECCLQGDLGVRCPELRAEPGERLDAAFFGESQGRFIVSASSRAVPELQTLAKRHHVELQMLGLAGGDHLEFEGQLRVSLAELRVAFEQGLLQQLEGL